MSKRETYHQYDDLVVNVTRLGGETLTAVSLREAFPNDHDLIGSLLMDQKPPGAPLKYVDPQTPTIETVIELVPQQWRVLVQRDAYVNYEAIIEATSPEAATELAKAAWKANDREAFVNVSVSEFDAIACDPENAEVVDPNETVVICGWVLGKLEICGPTVRIEEIPLDLDPHEFAHLSNS